jgi:cyclophilin family peptidyl-prolyl cis-trans isomerase
MYQLLLSALCIVAVTGARESSKCRETVYASALQDTCGEQMRLTAPDSFHITFGSNYGEFVAQCERQRAPVWVDRIYNLVLNGYYNNNYFFRVIEDFVVQFGTNGDPSISNIYNFNSPDLGTCGILEPQPPFMSINEGIRGLSNVFGTVSMSTSYNEMTETTWNATAELFINLGNNRYSVSPLSPCYLCLFFYVIISCMSVKTLK